MTNTFHHQRTLMGPLYRFLILLTLSKGCGRSMTNFHLSLRKELEGEQIHQNVQKYHITGARNKN